VGYAEIRKTTCDRIVHVGLPRPWHHAFDDEITGARDDEIAGAHGTESKRVRCGTRHGGRVGTPRAQLNHPDCFTDSTRTLTAPHIPEISAKFTGPNFDRWAIVLAQMSDERILREKARAAIRSGQLPSRQPDVVIRSQSDRFSGPASRTLCAVCGKGMTSDQMEIEVFFAREEVPTSSDRHVLHVGCFVAWECEREVL